MWEQQLKVFFKLIEWFTYLGLLIASVVFVQDAWTNYKKKDIGVKINKVRREDLMIPTISICFEPIAKLSVLQRNGLTINEFSYGTVTKKLAKSWSDFYHEASYRLGYDFNVTLDYDNFNESLQIKLFDINEQPLDNLVTVEEFYTIWSGLCFKITPKIRTGRAVENKLLLEFSKTLPIEDVPNVKVFFTSENNSYGVIDVSWYEGDEYFLRIDPRKNQDYNIDFRIKQYDSLKSDISHCSDTKSFYECASKR